MAERTTRGGRWAADLTKSATWRMQAALATELPPNFMTMAFIGTFSFGSGWMGMKTLPGRRKIGPIYRLGREDPA
jgi:hypothetical protein